MEAVEGAGNGPRARSVPSDSAMEMDPWIADAVDSFLSSSRVSQLPFRSALRSRVKVGRLSPPPSRTLSSDQSTEPDMSEKFPSFEELKEKLRMRQDEIFKLQAANSDLTQVNKRWHRYNSDMQVFIEKLQTTIRDQQEQISRILSSEEKDAPRERAPENGECSRKSCKATREEVKKLKERVKHLELQVKSHKEDWEAERAEKKSVSEAKDELERRFSAALRDLYSVKRSREEGNESSNCPLCPTYSLPSSSNRDVQTVIHCNHSPQIGCSRRRDFLFGNVVCDSGDDRDSASALTTTGITAAGVAASRSLGTLSVGIKSSSFVPVARSPSAPSTTFSETEDDISCPACDRVFSSRVHLEFLDHFEACPSRRIGPE